MPIHAHSFMDGIEKLLETVPLTIPTTFDRNRYNYTGYTTPEGYEDTDEYIVLLPDSLSSTCRRFRLSTLTATEGSDAWRFHMLMFWDSQVRRSTFRMSPRNLQV